MTGWLLLGGAACLAFGLPMALGFTDMCRIALAALFVSAPLEVYRTEAVIGNLSVFRIVLVLAVLVVLRERRSALRPLLGQPITLAVAALLLTMALSLVFLSHNRSLGLAVLGQGLLVFVAALTTASLAHGLPAQSILRLACLGAALPVLAAATQGFYAHAGQSFGLPLVNHLPVPKGLEVTRSDALYLGDDGVRLKGTFGDPNHFAVWLVFMLASSFALTISIALRSSRSAVVAGIVWCAGLSLVLLATYSRTGWLSAAVAVTVAVIVTLLSPGARALLRRHRRWTMIAICICALALLSLLPRIGDRLDNGRSANRISNESHAQTTRFAYEQFLAHPVAGIGLSDLGPRLGQDQRTSGAHSSYLTVAAELGLPGLVVTLVLLGLVARALLPSARGTQDDQVARFGLFCAYMGFIIANAFYDLLWDDFHWLFVGVALAATIQNSSARDVVRSIDDKPPSHVAADHEDDGDDSPDEDRRAPRLRPA